MCPLLSAPSTASSSCLTPSPYLSGPFSFRQQILPLCRISRSTKTSHGQEFLSSGQFNDQPILPYTSRKQAHPFANCSIPLDLLQKKIPLSMLIRSGCSIRA